MIAGEQCLYDKKSGLSLLSFKVSLTTLGILGHQAHCISLSSITRLLTRESVSDSLRSLPELAQQ